MYEPTGRNFPTLAFLWPAFVAAAASETAAWTAKQFADLAVGQAGGAARTEPHWTTPHAIALDLKAVRLRDFTTDENSPPALVCAPFALHGAAATDLAPGHSLVAALRAAGLRRLFVTDWRPARADMRFRGIDDYLADLNVLVDEIGAPVDLIGLCQGGWMALVYAARFPAKVRKLVLAGAPVDITAAPSALSDLAVTTPLPVFHELLRIGDGIVPGPRVLKFWGVESVDAEDVRQTLQTGEPLGSAGFNQLEALFRAWYAWTVDLPGTYFLEVVDKIYKHNEIATGVFAVLGRQVNLATVTAPTYLLAAADDELVAAPQLFAAERLLGTPAANIGKAIAPGRHISLFAGKTVLDEAWPKIVRWLHEPMPVAPHHAPASSIEFVE